MTDYRINIYHSEEDGGYVADIPDLESCSAFGETAEKVLTEVEVPKAAWLKLPAKRVRRSQSPVTGR